MLNFPNQSRSFDHSAQGVRFIGYDGMFEVRFVVEAKAFSQGLTEHGSLQAFDANREAVYQAAVAVYSKDRKNICFITAADLRSHL